MWTKYKVVINEADDGDSVQNKGYIGGRGGDKGGKLMNSIAVCVS